MFFLVLITQTRIDRPKNPLALSARWSDRCLGTAWIDHIRRISFASKMYRTRRDALLARCLLCFANHKEERMVHVSQTGSSF